MSNFESFDSRPEDVKRRENLDHKTKKDAEQTKLEKDSQQKSKNIEKKKIEPQEKKKLNIVLEPPRAHVESTSESTASKNRKNLEQAKIKVKEEKEKKEYDEKRIKQRQSQIGIN